MPRAVSSSETQSRGRDATTPAEIPARGWKDILWRLAGDFSRNRILSLAASVTYYALLAIFPAIAAIVTLYGLFSDPSSIQSQLDSLSAILPGGAISVVGDQIKALAANQDHKTFGIALVGGLVVALWSASSGVKAMFDALNVIYGEEEKRSFLKLASIALLFTLGAIVLVLLGIVATVAVPVVTHALSLPKALSWILTIARWPILLVAIAVGLAVTYYYGPSRDHPKWRWISWGSAFGSIGWLAVSALFSWYAANFGSFNATYGSLGAVIGFMTWLWLSATVVLLGAQINAEMEHQTAEDTTEGPPRPMGQRGARAADTLGKPR